MFLHKGRLSQIYEYYCPDSLQTPPLFPYIDNTMVSKLGTDLIFLGDLFRYSVQLLKFCQIRRRTDQHDLLNLPGLEILETRHLLTGTDAGLEDGLLMVGIVGFGG